MLCAACCNVRVRMCSARVQCVCTEHFVRGWRVGSRIVGCLLALLALLKGKWIKPKQHRLMLILNWCELSFKISCQFTISKSNVDSITNSFWCLSEVPLEGAWVPISTSHQGYCTEASYVHYKVDTIHPKVSPLCHIAEKQFTLQIIHLVKKVGT